MTNGNDLNQKTPMGFKHFCFAVLSYIIALGFAFLIIGMVAGCSSNNSIDTGEQCRSNSGLSYQLGGYLGFDVLRRVDGDSLRMRFTRGNVIVADDIIYTSRKEGFQFNEMYKGQNAVFVNEHGMEGILVPSINCVVLRGKLERK